ncbi:MAG TPA: hypothetical protein VE109_11475 [Acidobacteriaceae bacterium]|nr:hypothetical protein [Acidobacteriaceae bacterium]
MMELRLVLATLCVFVSVAARHPTPQTAAPAASPAPAPALVNLSAHATALATLGEIGLQTRVPIGIIPGADAGALCRTKTTFVFLGEDPRSALDAMAQQLHYTLNQENGVYLLSAQDVTEHQRDVLDHRFPVYRTGGKSIVQTISMRLSEALWVALAKPVVSGHGGPVSHSVKAHSVDAQSVDEPKISLPPVLHNVTTQEIAGLVVKSGPGGIYLSRIQPSRMASAHDLTIQISTYGDEDQLKLDMSCPR